MAGIVTDNLNEQMIGVSKMCIRASFNTGGSRSDPTYAQEIFESAAMPTNGWIETYYKDLYTTIYLCNLVIEKFNSEDSVDVYKRQVFNVFHNI